VSGEEVEVGFVAHGQRIRERAVGVSWR
jgi:hypothetical protein